MRLSRYLSSVAGMATVLAAMPAVAQDSTLAPDQTIVVTGSRAANRTVANSPVPIDVISSSAITEGGQVETNRVLNKLIPSFNFPSPAISDGSDAIRPATLRGLSPDQTLVLVNGKRRHVSALLNINGTVGRGSAAVDINTIPGLAIDRIEVLRDGASSQYGSDAIAGVVNIRIKTANHGGRMVATYGEYNTTENGVSNVTGLQTNAAGQPFLDSTGLYLTANTSGERKVHDGRSYSTSANVGLPFFGVRDGYMNITASYQHRGRTNRQGADLRPQYIQPTATTFDPRELTADRLRFRIGDPIVDDYNLFANLGAPVGDFEIYSTLSFDERNSISAANLRRQNEATNRDFAFVSPNATLTDANFVPLTPDGFLPFIKSELIDYAGTIGIKGQVAGWKTDLSAGYGNNTFSYRTENSINQSIGASSPRSFDSGGLRYGQFLANLDVSHDYDVGFAKPVALAFGAEYRREEFGIRPGEPASYLIGQYTRGSITTTAANCATQQGVFAAATGICSFPGRTAGAGAQGFGGLPASARTSVSRHNIAVYAEVDADPIKNVSTTFAGRYEHYSDFGSTWTGKAAGRWEFIPGYAVRGAVSTGFRAPSLQQQYFTTTSTNFVAGVPVDISTVAVASPLARALGSKDLKPEKSLNLSGGFTANPVSGLTLSIDYYNIRIRNRIVLTENLGAAGSGNTAATNAAIQSVLNAQGYSSVGAARFFINGLDTRSQGIDAVASYRLPLPTDVGRWSVTAAYNHSKQKILQYRNNLSSLSAIPNLILFGHQESIRFTSGQPKDKIVLTLDGDVGPVGITARSTRYGKVISPGTLLSTTAGAPLTDLGPDDIILQPKWITDLEARVKVTKKVQLAIGADNAFDVYPTRSPYGAHPAGVAGNYPTNQQYFPYSIFSPFGFNGRYLYGRVSVDF